MTKVSEPMKLSHCRRRACSASTLDPEHGASLITVLLILVIVSLIGVGSAQIALMGERGSRSSRDIQVAWQSAEAALIDADIDLYNNVASTSRTRVFDGKTTSSFPSSGCGTSGDSKGLCASVTSGKPNWLIVDFTGSTDVTTLGDYTGRSFSAGGTGTQPALKPRYVIEPVLAQTGDKASLEQEVVYRVTAMGFGPRTDIQAVLQMLYRN